ncbi:MAG TPA: tetratricopeptide repeat protein [Polyangia bacterium]|nr:tetratricopeptide repeat protein [Polyangia bacterium]
MNPSRAAFLLVAVGCLGACAAHSELGGDTFEARKKLARELERRGEWTPAFSYADQLHRERPRDAETLVLRGVIYRERGMWTESEKDLLEAVKLDGASPEAHAALGILYDVTFRPALAEPQHRAAVKLAPDAAGYLNNLGFSLFLRGKYREAIEQYEKAASLDPTSRRVRTNLGFACAAQGDLRRAAHEFEMGGTAAEAKNNLGFAYERRGDIKRAYDLYLEATTLDPKSTHARSNLVHVAELLGRDVPAATAVPEPVQVVVPTTTVPAPDPGAAAAPLAAPGGATAPALPAEPPKPATKPESIPSPKDTRP